MIHANQNKRLEQPIIDEKVAVIQEAAQSALLI
jgi:hypothetical protein